MLGGDGDPRDNDPVPIGPGDDVIRHNPEGFKFGTLYERKGRKESKYCVIHWEEDGEEHMFQIHRGAAPKLGRALMDQGGSPAPPESEPLSTSPDGTISGHEEEVADMLDKANYASPTGGPDPIEKVEEIRPELIDEINGESTKAMKHIQKEGMPDPEWTRRLTEDLRKGLIAYGALNAISTHVMQQSDSLKADMEKLPIDLEQALSHRAHVTEHVLEHLTHIVAMGEVSIDQIFGDVEVDPDMDLDDMDLPFEE